MKLLIEGGLKLEVKLGGGAPTSWVKAELLEIL